MIRPAVDLATLRLQLDSEIETALVTAEHLGVTLVSCHLQMARDMLGVPLAGLPRPRHDATDLDQD
ncbi:hypothetical protein ACG3SL_04595 [Sphingomonas sp. CJ20]